MPIDKGPILVKYFRKYQNIINYLFFGILSTLLNIIIYQLFIKIFTNLISNIIAWIITIIFVFITNKIWVFKNDIKNPAGILKEFIKFICCRILTGIMDMGIMLIGVDILLFNSLIIKILSNIIVIILNFIFSKLIIFKKKGNI